MTDTEVKCKVPGCERPAVSRGVCNACALYLKKGADAECRALIAEHILPDSRAGRGGKKPRGCKPTAAERQSLANDPDLKIALDEAGDRTTLDEVISTCTELCTVLGVERIKYQGGFMFISPETGAAAELTADGLVYKNEFRRVAS